jgi:hypothetical protein
LETAWVSSGPPDIKQRIQLIASFRIQICDALAGMGYAAVGSFVTLALMELVMYPWGLTDPEDNIITDRDDIPELEWIEMQRLE